MKKKGRIGIRVPDAKRKQQVHGFICSHCGKPIKAGEYYYCVVLTKEKYRVKNGEYTVIPKEGMQLATWCKGCYGEILKI